MSAGVGDIIGAEPMPAREGSGDGLVTNEEGVAALFSLDVETHLNFTNYPHFTAANRLADLQLFLDLQGCRQLQYTHRPGADVAVTEPLLAARRRTRGFPRRRVSVDDNRNRVPR